MGEEQPKPLRVGAMSPAELAACRARWAVYGYRVDETDRPGIYRLVRVGPCRCPKCLAQRN